MLLPLIFSAQNSSNNKQENYNSEFFYLDFGTYKDSMPNSLALSFIELRELNIRSRIRKDGKQFFSKKYNSRAEALEAQKTAFSSGLHNVKVVKTTISEFAFNHEFKVNLGTYKGKLPIDISIAFKNLKHLEVKAYDKGLGKEYLTKSRNSYEEVLADLSVCKFYIANSKIVIYKDGVPITLARFLDNFPFNEPQHDSIFILGEFVNHINESDFKASIKVQNAENDKFIGNHFVNENHFYNILLPEDRKYKFIVETPLSEKIHVAFVEVPPKDEFKFFKQKIELKKINGNETLFILNQFDEKVAHQNEKGEVILFRPSDEQNTKKTITQAEKNVDYNIPSSPKKHENTYALIIGNEDYTTFQTDLNTEINVDYAENDARIFKEYCNKTLGIPSEQIKLLVNATYGQIKQSISWLKNLAKIEGGRANIIFYYSGHGLPDEVTKEGYLMPVDISGTNVKSGISLNSLYKDLNAYPSNRITVFLDACFSGGARNQGLIAMKGVKIKPREEPISGNMVVFASSSGNESSGVYREKHHGYFTYFLLKKLQETKGSLTYKEMSDYLNYQVSKKTALSGKIQTPQVNVSSSVANSWENWSFRKI